MSIYQDPRSLPPCDWGRTYTDCQRGGIPAADAGDPLKTGVLRRDMDEHDEYGMLANETATTKRLKER